MKHRSFLFYDQKGFCQIMSNFNAKGNPGKNAGTALEFQVCEDEENHEKHPVCSDFTGNGCPNGCL